MSIVENKIKELTKKTPHYTKWFVETYNKNRVPYILIESIYNKMRTYKELLRDNNINILEKSSDERNINQYKYNSFEQLDDKLTEIIINNEKRKYALSFLSKKYKHLIDDNTLELFYEIKKMNFEHYAVNESLNKIAAYKNPEDLNIALQKFIEKNTKSNILNIKNEILKYNTKVFVEDHSNNIIIAEINDYTASRNLGSSSWCISYNKSYFDNYLKGKLFRNRQFFMWDFNQKSINKEHMLGFTVDFMGNVTAAHYKNDNSIPKDIINRIIFKYDLSFSNLSNIEILKEINEKFKQPGAKIKNIVNYINDGESWAECFNYYKSNNKDSDIVVEIINKVNNAKKSNISKEEKNKVIKTYLSFISNVIENIREYKNEEDKSSYNKWKNILKEIAIYNDFSFIINFLKNKHEFNSEEITNIKIFYELLQEKEANSNRIFKNLNTVTEYENDSEFIKSVYNEKLDPKIKIILFINYIAKNGLLTENIIDKYCDLIKEKSNKSQEIKTTNYYLGIGMNIMNSVINYSSNNNIHLKSFYNKLNVSEHISFEDSLEKIYKDKNNRRLLLVKMFKKESNINLSDLEFKTLGNLIQEDEIGLIYENKNSFKYIKKLNNQHLNENALSNINTILINLNKELNFEEFKDCLDFAIQNSNRKKVINKGTIVSAFKTDQENNYTQKKYLQLLYSKLNIKDYDIYNSALNEFNKNNKYADLRSILDSKLKDTSLEDFIEIKNNALSTYFSRKRVYKEDDLNYLEKELSNLPSTIIDRNKLIENLSTLLSITKNNALFILENKINNDIIIESINKDNKDPAINFLVNKIKMNREQKLEINAFIQNKKEVIEEKTKKQEVKNNRPKF